MKGSENEITSKIVKNQYENLMESGFRFIPNIVNPAHNAGKEVVLVPYKGVLKLHADSIVGYQPGQPNHYSSAVTSLIKGKYVFGNILKRIDKLGTVMTNFFHDLSKSGRIYLSSRGIFLALNITGVQYASFRYLIWGVSVVIQLCFCKSKWKYKMENFSLNFSFKKPHGKNSRMI